MTDTESCSKPRPLRDISQFLRTTGTQQQRTANQLQEALPWCIVGDVIPVRQEDGLVQILIPDLDLGLTCEVSAGVAQAQIRPPPPRQPSNQQKVYSGQGAESGG